MRDNAREAAIVRSAALRLAFLGTAIGFTACLALNGPPRCRCRGVVKLTAVRLAVARHAPSLAAV
jgi:hypothetical protein